MFGYPTQHGSRQTFEAANECLFPHCTAPLNVPLRVEKGVQVSSSGVLKAGDGIWAGGCSLADTDTHLAKILYS